MTEAEGAPARRRVGRVGTMWFTKRSCRASARALALIMSFAAGLVAMAVPTAAGQGAPAVNAPVRSCESLGALRLPNTTVVSAEEDPGNPTTPVSCRVTLSVADPVDDGVVTVWVYLPVTTWNGRFQGVGGGGFSGGDPARLVDALRTGYAAAATDAGHMGSTSEFALNRDGSLNWPAINDFGHEGVHDMTVTANHVVSAYYGRAPAFSYFNGCSTGGRQGVMEAQRYPGDYDGILSGAPLINFPKMQTGQMWGQVAMLEDDNPVAPCKFETAVRRMIERCDTVGDGVRDGVIGDPLACDFDVTTLVGQQTPCGVITAADAEVMRKIGVGPRRQNGEFLWYGLAPGAPFAGLNDTIEVDGRLVGAPFTYDLWWFSLWLAQDRDYDWRTLTYTSFEDYFDLAVSRYDAVMGASNPDLSAFRDSGGKLLLWHGAADFGVPYQGTVDYYQRVRQKLGPGAAQQFMRLFVAPGVGHCRGGAGAQPVDPLNALVAWVEQGKAPRTLYAATTDENGTITATRPICRYPFVARWTGQGDATDGSNYQCVPSTRMQLPPADGTGGGG